MRLDQLPWTEVAPVAATRLLAVPVGSTEQHGPHLPLSTDSDLAVALCDRLAAARDDVLVAPPVAYGAAGEHAAFPGTLSIGTEVTTAVLVEIARSADAFAGVLFVSAHGGNRAAVSAACHRLVAESRRVRAWAPPVPPGGDAHAGRTETSAMLAVRPQAVHAALAAAGCREPLASLLPRLRAGGVASVSANGVLGDPDGAGPEEGERLLGAWTAALADFVGGWP